MENKIRQYRGKATLDNRWVYGFYVERKSYDYGMIYDDEGLGTDVNKKTVGQAIGLEDKNKKMIFEDDLVNCYTKNGELVYKHPQRVTIPEWYKLIWDETNTEIIGNKFESPELLK